MHRRPVSTVTKPRLFRLLAIQPVVVVSWIIWHGAVAQDFPEVCTRDNGAMIIHCPRLCESACYSPTFLRQVSGAEQQCRDRNVRRPDGTDCSKPPSSVG